MLNTPLPPWPSFSDEEAKIASEVLLSNRVNSWTGDQTQKFECEFAQYLNAEHAIAVANGTLALELCLIAGGVSTGDEVIVTPRTFLASISCIVRVGAIPVFADVDLNTGNINAESISKVLTKKTRAIICVHLGGIPCDMEPIMALAHSHNLFVIEDCAQAHGAEYRGKKLGSIGHCSAFSFCQDKIMTTAGEGGLFVTNDRVLWAKAWSYKDHGKSWEAVFNQEHESGFRWLHESFGSNYRMTEIQAAIGRYQLGQLDGWLATRAKNASKLATVAEKFDFLRLAEEPDGSVSAIYKFYIYLIDEKLPNGWNRDRLQESINHCDIPCYQGSCSEVYLEKAFKGRDFAPKERLKNAKQLGQDSLCFLVHPTITEEVMDEVCMKLLSLLNEVKKEC